MKGQAIDSVEQMSNKLSSSDPFNGVLEGGMVRVELQTVEKE